MKPSALILLTALTTTLACVASSTSWATPQQDRMKNCNAEAKTQSLSGQPRKDFMKACLSGKTASSATAADATAAGATATSPTDEKKPANAKERMKWCNGKAKGMKGDERKTFMSSCLKAG